MDHPYRSNNFSYYYILHLARSAFYLGRGIVQKSEPGQVVCYIDYANGNGEHITKEIQYQNAICNRIPYVAVALTAFIAKLREFNYIKSANQITVSGFSLGGHLAGILGRNLNVLFKKPIRMVLGKIYQHNFK